jgi:hypothetical protein
MDELGVFRKVFRDPVVMHLVGQVVKETDIVTGGQQGIRKVRSHKSCSAGDEYVFCHS